MKTKKLFVDSPDKEGARFMALNVQSNAPATVGLTEMLCVSFIADFGWCEFDAHGGISCKNISAIPIARHR